MLLQSREAIKFYTYQVSIPSNSIRLLIRTYYTDSYLISLPFTHFRKEVEFIEMDNTMKDIMKMLKYRDDVKDIVEKAKLRVHPS